jgi:hypothetical protein
VGKTTVSFGQQGWGRLDRKPVSDLIKEVVPSPLPDMLQVRAHVSARTPSGAFELGQHSMDYARGVWNFLINRRTTALLFSSVPNRPVNEILPAGVHTVHTPNGKLAAKAIWVETYTVSQLRLYSGDLPKIEAAAEKIRQRIRQSKYSEDIEHAFVRYTRALDIPDHATAFARLWTTIEYLADTSDHDTLIQRIAFLTTEKDRKFVDLVLRHMRDVRNGIVHIDQSRERTDIRGGMEAYLYQLRLFAEWLLLFHVNATKYQSRKSAAEFLDTPSNPEQLRRLIRLYWQVLKRRS